MADQYGAAYGRWNNYPASAGHLEIVPFRHVLSFFDLTDDEAHDLHHLARRMKTYLDHQLHPDGYTLGVNDGTAAGRSVPHLHIHIIPRWHGDVPDPRGGIRRIFPHCDPGTWR
ncbi:HIT domain-containing protein [Nocardia transvalensis]|uniref:HIT domain-containing protein n=1 Tax=Nocardia transvalensis TaxID=37333 RepID=UPI002B4ABA74|nr:HIT domain-containing protein [Nocardia transvalensis]